MLPGNMYVHSHRHKNAGTPEACRRNMRGTLLVIQVDVDSQCGERCGAERRAFIQIGSIFDHRGETANAVQQSHTHHDTLCYSMFAPSHSGFVLENDPTAPREEATVSFRDIIPSSEHPRIAGINQHDALSWCDSRTEVPAAAWLIDRLKISNIERPYKGFSADGNPNASVLTYSLDEGAPVEEACKAVEDLLRSLDSEERSEVIKGDVGEDDEFRAWSNPELYINPGVYRSLSGGR